jgi:hypothetical protein
MVVAVAADANAQALAFEYVDRLRPCYEGEGYHDCPEREAVFAAKFSAAKPSGPFKEYLPLLAAHRWLCAAEAHDYEKRPKDAARSRRAYEDAISVARGSSALLIRVGSRSATAAWTMRLTGLRTGEWFGRGMPDLHAAIPGNFTIQPSTHRSTGIPTPFRRDRLITAAEVASLMR